MSKPAVMSHRSTTIPESRNEVVFPGFLLRMKKTISASLLALASIPALGAPASSLSVGDGFVELLGFHEPQPAFSWKLPVGIKAQTAYRLETKVGDQQWDSGWINSGQSTFVPWSGAPLGSRQRVEWQVDFRDEKGKEHGWSAPAHFELGLLSATDWQAQWIRPAGDTDLTKEPVGCLRRSFSLGQKVARARLYVTARGLFELSINGTRVGNDHFANGFTPYDKRLDTLTYDVTGQLHAGSNTIEGLLGAGWYAGRIPFAPKVRGTYGKDAALLAQLEITFADGSAQTIATDGKWEGTFDGPIISSSIYDGETYDARRQPAHWAPVVAEPISGPAALQPKPFPPVRNTDTLAVREITQPQPGRYIFDLGQDMVGWARLKVPAEKDQTVTIRFAEMLKADGTLYTENYRTAKSTDSYTAAQAGVVEWEPHFTFHGFRYVELSGFSKGVTPQKDWVTGVVIHSDLRTTGTFISSSPKLNQLQSNLTWGWRGNSVDIPTDCPQRDERMGWTGDAEVFCPTAMFLTDSHAFWDSWLRSMRDEQEADGAIPDIVPNASKGFKARSPGWMDAATIIPWQVYLRTGDPAILADNFAMMEKLVGWYRAQSVDGLLPKINGYGDWLQPYPQVKPVKRNWMGDRHGDTPSPLLGAAYYAHSAQILADSARVLRRNDEAKRYGDEAAAVRAAFVKEYFDASGKLQNAPETQTAYVLALAFDLLPPELREGAGANLARLVVAADNHLRTGFLGTPYLTSALDQTGHGDLACDLLFQETYPSWFYPINQGATTMWERWNSYTRDKGFGDVSMNSFNHYAYGAIGQWMVERVAGLAPDPAHPGYQHFFIRPLVGKQLDYAQAKLETPFGTASSAWRRKDGKVALEIVVPPNTTATIEFPDHRPAQTVAAGTYHFESDVK